MLFAAAIGALMAGDRETAAQGKPSAKAIAINLIIAHLPFVKKLVDHR